MDFNSKYDDLIKNRIQCAREWLDLDKKKEEELEQATKNIKDKYTKLQENKSKELDEHLAELDSYCQMLESYSYFEEKMIGNVIANLMSIFEGIDFTYQDTYYDTKEVIHLALDTEATKKVRKYTRVIVAEEYKDSEYSDKGTNLNLLVSKGNALILVGHAKHLPNGILFYRAKSIDHSLEQTIKFGKFTYVKEFIDRLISYKLENEIKNISIDEIIEIQREFISSNLEQIQKNYCTVEQQREEQMKKKLETEQQNRQLKLKRILDK